MFSIEGQMRYQGTSIFSSAKSIEIAKLENVYKSWITDDNLVNDNISAKLFHSPKILYAKLIFHQAIHEKKSGRLVVDSEVTLVCLNKDFKPVAIPEDMKQQLAGN